MIKILQGNEEINSNGGNILIGALLQLKTLEKLNMMQTGRIKHGEIGHRDILKLAAGLLSLGRSNFADVELFCNDPLFKETLNLSKVPSAETLRQRLNDLALCNEDQTLIDDCVVEMLQKVRDFGKIETSYGQYIPLDIDVSVMLQPNCKKEGVSWIYHNAMGYAPIFCHVGTHRYMLANELRKGSQHSTKGAVEFVSRCIKNARRIGFSAEELLVRVNSGHDDADFRIGGPDAAADLKAVDPRQHDVQQSHLGIRVGPEPFQCLLAGLSLDHIVARPAEIDNNEAADAGFILQNQNFLHESSSISISCPLRTIPCRSG